MTTIACKDGHMACDSCWTGTNGLAEVSANKVIRLRSGALVGASGDNDVREIIDLLQDVGSFAEMPKISDFNQYNAAFDAIMLFPDGTMAQVVVKSWGDDSDTEPGAWIVNRGFTATGSGGVMALGAMAAGKTAAEAAAISCDWDPNSKAPVHDFTCQPPASRQDTTSRQSTRTKTKSKPSSGSRRTATQRRSLRRK